MKTKIIAFIKKQGFNPGLAGLFINPFYFARKGLFRHIIELSPMIGGRILDVGCGSKPYQDFIQHSEYIGLEITDGNPNADCYYDGKHMPFPDGDFDSIITSQVFEHVFNPGEFLSELNRVLKDNGTLLLTVPFVWDEHEQPYDYARYSSFGLQHLLETHGFEILEQRKSMTDVRVIFQLINAYLYKKTVTGNAYLNLIVTLILMAPFNVLGEIFGWLLPKNDDLYLDNILLARKKHNTRE